MTNNEDEPINVDDLVEELPDERKMIAFQRALKRFGVDYTITPEGGVEVIDEAVDSVESLGELLDQDSFIYLFEDELKRLVANDFLMELRDQGYIRANGINDDGEVLYTRTDKPYEG